MHLRLRLLRENPGPEQMEAFEKEVEGTAKIVAWLQQFASQRSAGPIEVVELEEIVREVLALVRPEAVRVGEGAVRLKYQGMRVGTVFANAIELRELLVSLLLYVRDQLAAGGELEIVANQDEKHVICTMGFRADVGGPSRPEEWLAPVAQEGMAPLALAAMTARELLERWGGKLAARSLETGEAEFVLYFQPAQQVPIESPPIAQTVKKEGRKILVVDDDPDNAMMLAEVLFAEGHQAQTAESGKEALEKWKSEIFDIALVDLLMPDISGLDLANLLFRENRNARIALVTGWDLDEKQKGEASVHAIFRKPVNLDELFSFLGPLNELVSEEPSPSSVE
jgi:CheY-like chemotaxis protein